jgi:hypothetical protein
MLLGIVILILPLERTSERSQNATSTPTPIISSAPLSTPLITQTPQPASTATSEDSAISPHSSILPPDAILLKLNESKVDFLSPKKWTNFIFEGVENSPIILIYEPVNIEQASGLIAGVEFEIKRLNDESVEKRNASSDSKTKFAFTPPSTEKYILKVKGITGFGNYRIILRTPDKLDVHNE